MDRIIIGVHGLRNKPPANVLKDWWLLSIRDGFDNIIKPQLQFDFELMYWVDLLYKEPADPFISDRDDPLYFKSPYKKIQYNDPPHLDLKRQRRRKRFEKITDQLFHIDRLLESFEGISDRLIHSRFHDLEVYLRNWTGNREAQDRPIRDVILERLGQLLLKHRHKKIMLLAHSMGSILVYDLLTQPNNPFHVHTLITMGSPLGQPTIMSKFTSENPVVSKLKTPDNVEHWYNFSDLKDIVAIDPTLGDDYDPNINDVSPMDVFIENRYDWGGVANPHSAFGYLQSHECATYIYQFLTENRSKVSLCIDRKIQMAYELLTKDRIRRMRRSPSRKEAQNYLK